MIESKENYAIVAFGNIDGPGQTIPARRVFERLFSAGIWYITRPTRTISVGTRVLFYQNASGFRGSAVVRKVINDRTNLFFGTQTFFTFAQRLVLDQLQEFDAPLNIRHFVNSLDFITNKTYWGHAFRTTPRSISQNDYMTIVEHAKHQNGT